jgi:starch phosphorylase
MTPEERRNVVPRVCIIGGKAAPGYEIAKKIIKLVNAVGVKINNDADIGNLLKVVSPSLPNHVYIQHMARLVYYALKTINSFFPFQLDGKQIFIPDYNVSMAELVIPASDLSQHIRSDSTITPHVLVFYIPKSVLI